MHLRKAKVFLPTLQNVCLSLQLEEKARLEAEAREREEQQLLEEQQRRQEEEEAALQKELLRLQELQQPRAAKKKKKEKAKENTAPPQNNPQPLKQTAQNVLDNLQNGKSRQLQTLALLPDQKEPRIAPVLQPTTLHSSEKRFSSQTSSSVTLHSSTSSCQLETHSKVKARQSPKVTSCEAAVKKDPELPKSSDVTVKLGNGSAPTTATDTKASRIRPAEAPPPVPATDSRKDDRNSIRSTSGKREQQQQPLTQTKEERRSPPVSNPSPSPPPSSQCEQPQQNGKPPSPESPQPKGKNKKNKKKKGDKVNSSIGWCFRSHVGFGLHKLLVLSMKLLQSF